MILYDKLFWVREREERWVRERGEKGRERGRDRQRERERERGHLSMTVEQRAVYQLYFYLSPHAEQFANT